MLGPEYLLAPAGQVEGVGFKPVGAFVGQKFLHDHIGCRRELDRSGIKPPSIWSIRHGKWAPHTLCSLNKSEQNAKNNTQKNNYPAKK